jgi:hypothetical protein
MLNCDKLKEIAIAIGIRDRIEAAFPLSLHSYGSIL